MKNFNCLFNLGFLSLSVSVFAQSNPAANQSMAIGMRTAATVSRMYDPTNHLHSKFIIPKQKQADGFKKLMARDDEKIAEMEIEIQGLKNNLGKADDRSRAEKKIEKRQRWLDVIKRERQKFEEEINMLESEIAAVGKK